MRRLLLVSVLVLASIPILTQSFATQTRTASADFPAAEVDTSLLFDCLPDGTTRVHLAWRSSFQGPQWVDLSLFDNDFALGTFLSSGPLPPAQTALAWDGLLANTVHYVRVNTITASGWFPSQTMIFATPNDCPFAIQMSVPGSSTVFCPDLTLTALSGCVWTLKPDFAVYSTGEIVTYCYFVSQATNVRIIAIKPDATALVIVDGFVNAGGACLGPYQANIPLGLRTVSMYGGPDMHLLAESHFFVQ